MNLISPGHGTEITTVSLQIPIPLIENSPDAKSRANGADSRSSYSWWFRSKTRPQLRPQAVVDCSGTAAKESWALWGRTQYDVDTLFTSCLIYSLIFFESSKPFKALEAEKRTKISN